jgi:hypothetical protein
MIGITHAPDGRKMIREPKTLKVGIGYPRGKAADVFVDGDGAWNIRVGKKGADKKMKWDTVARFPTRGEGGVVLNDARTKAENAFRKAWKEADVCTYPRKVAFFQFTRPIMGDDGAEIYVPDFAAIEAHSFADPKKPGPPTEIDIVFLDDDPFTGGYQMWSSSELKCYGDGENAMRVVSMASSDEEKVLANAAVGEGKKHFPIIGGCWTCNCPYSKEGTDDRGRPTPAPCKPGADIKFQLTRNIRVGGTAFFHTSSFRSIPQIFSSIERIKELTGGRIAGIPLKMVIRSHKTNHNGQAAIQQNVSIEFRTQDMESLRKDLIEQAWKFRAAAGISLPAPARMIASAEEAVDIETIEEQSNMSAQAMGNEFYVDDEEGASSESAEPEKVTASGNAATATTAKQTRIAEQLAKREPGQDRQASQQPDPDPNPIYHDKQSLQALLMTEMQRIGKPAFDEVVGRHGMISKLTWDNPKTAGFYEDLKKVPAPGAQPAAAMEPAAQKLPEMSDDF